MTGRVTRLAPSPTGTLHVGNARTFLLNWAMARNGGWRIVMRIEDLDATRVRPGAAEQILDLLAWLGLDFDDGPIYQSHDLEPYRRAMQALSEAGLAYACALSRRELEQAPSAPHSDDAAASESAPPTRPRDPEAFAFRDERTNYRLVVPDEPIAIDDEIAGRSIHHPLHEAGDFAIWTRLGVPAYQLAVVVDDHRQRVTDVVRGDDLLPSAARQALIYRALGFEPPRWWHVPLVVGDDGRRLAKRHGDSHLETYRRAGVPPERLIGLLAGWCGVAPGRLEMSADEFRQRFKVNTLPRQPVRFTADDHQWLLDQ